MISVSTYGVLGTQLLVVDSKGVHGSTDQSLYCQCGSCFTKNILHVSKQLTCVSVPTGVSGNHTDK